MPFQSGAASYTTKKGEGRGVGDYRKDVRREGGPVLQGIANVHGREGQRSVPHQKKCENSERTGGRPGRGGDWGSIFPAVRDGGGEIKVGGGKKGKGKGVTRQVPAARKGSKVVKGGAPKRRWGLDTCLPKGGGTTCDPKKRFHGSGVEMRVSLGQLEKIACRIIKAEDGEWMPCKSSITVSGKNQTGVRASFARKAPPEFARQKKNSHRGGSIAKTTTLIMG